MRTSLILIIVAAAVMYALLTPVAAIVVGGWRPIPNINDPHIQELGRWAVKEHVRRAKDGLKFNSVVSGDKVLGSPRYRLTIVALDSHGNEGKYQAVLLDGMSDRDGYLAGFVALAN